MVPNINFKIPFFEIEFLDGSACIRRAAAMCCLLYPVSAALASSFRTDFFSTSYTFRERSPTPPGERPAQAERVPTRPCDRTLPGVSLAFPDDGTQRQKRQR